MRIIIARQLITFLLTGGVAAAVNFTSRIFYNHFVDFPVAVALAFLTGMTTAFILAKRYVFPNSANSTTKSFMIFLMVNMFAFAQTWIITMALAYHALPAIGINQFNKDIASFVGIIAPVFTSFLAHKYISFKEA
jgi:putative flippase GtrA